MLNSPLRTPACRVNGAAGFTLVELLVVIGIIAILAGVALGPITNGLKKAKENAAMQTTRTLALAEFQYANDNNSTYPDGADAGVIGAALISGNYITDPSIFYISGDSKATRLTGTTTMTAANSSFDFSGVESSATPPGPIGVGVSAPDQLPLVWTPDPAITKIPTSTGGIEFKPSNPLFSTDGIAVCYHSNSAFFRAPVNVTPAAGAYPDTKGDALFIDSSFNPNGITYSIREGAAGY